MYKIKYAKKKNKKSSPFFAIIPSGKLLVMILTSPKAVLDKFRKNSHSQKNIYTLNNN